MHGTTQKLKLLYLKEIFEEETNNEHAIGMPAIIELLKQKNCTVDYVDINYIDKAVPLYQIIAMGEASSNLARYDGIRYGYSYETPENIEDLYLKTIAIRFAFIIH